VLSSVSTGRDVPLSLCAGTKEFSCPGVLCPGTRAGAKIPGQNPLSRDVPGQNHYLNVKKNCKKISKIVKKNKKKNIFFSSFFSFFFRNVLVVMVNIKVNSANK
jgi:hypothetical protein